MTDPLLARTAELASSFLAEVTKRPVGASPDADALARALGEEMPEHGEAPEAVTERLAEAMEPGLVATAGGRYFGFVVGATLPAALSADWLVSAWDQNVGFYVLSPAAATIEHVTSTWLKDLLGLPRDAAVGFVTGCQMANFMALMTARQSVLDREGWDVARQGLHGAPDVCVLTTAQTHGTIDRAIAMLGLGADRSIRVPCDAEGRMIPDALAERLQASGGPRIVCAQAGNVNTGSFDPFGAIGPLCREHGAWLHVDGAFGLWARTSPTLAPLAEGVELADSWATDAHKWLNVPYDSGIVVIRDQESLLRSSRYDGEYLVRSAGRAEPCLFTPESSRRARAVPVYAALRSLGRTGVADLVDRCCAHARRMAERLAAGGLEVLNDVVLNQVLCRVPHPDRTHDIIDRIQADGTCWLGGTEWRGAPALRISVSSWRTTAEDIDRSAEAIMRCIRDVGE